MFEAQSALSSHLFLSQSFDEDGTPLVNVFETR